MQLDIYDAVADTADNLIVQAVAGSGKTTTVVTASEFLPDGSRFFAFNKAIATELERRLPPKVRASTFHALGLSVVKQLFPRIKIDGKKSWHYLNEISTDFTDADGSFAVRVIGLLKASGVGLPDCPVGVEEAVLDLCEEHGMEPDEYEIEKAIPYIQRAYSASLEDTNMIDFDDMLLYPLLYNIPFPECPCAVIDEAQDTSSIQREMLRRLLEPEGRLIAVGDPRQAIYGFRGATATSLSLLASEFMAESFPLSTSYRCAKAVVREAQIIAPEISFHEDSPEGSVQHLTAPPNWATYTGAILCRNNAPLVALAYTLARDGIAFTFRGRNFAQGLTSVVDKLTNKKPTMLGVFRDKLDKWSDEQAKRRTVAAAMDKYEALLCLLAQLDRGSTTDGLKKLIVKLFTNREAPSPRTLSSIHQAKGLEWENVIFYFPSLLPSIFAIHPWQRVQEDNLKYVGITRAQRNLFFYEGDHYGKA